MSKRGYISRYLLIIKKLKAKPYSSFEELKSYFDNQMNFLQMQDDTLLVGFSKRTFQRDIREIRNIFGLDIKYSKSQKGYLIGQDDVESLNFQRMIEEFDMFNVLSFAHDLKPFIHPEKPKPQGLENLYGLLYAIKNKLQITFSYQKFSELESNVRTAEPYLLKGFKNRWYILANDTEDGITKSFALDRMSNLDITSNTFKYPITFDADENYRYSFGIISPAGLAPQEIILSFISHQGNYVKSLPLHDSQEILIDNENELRIKLKLCITYDLIMELMSYGQTMKVIEPQSLAEQIKSAHIEAANRYR